MLAWERRAENFRRALSQDFVARELPYCLAFFEKKNDKQLSNWLKNYKHPNPAEDDCLDWLVEFESHLIEKADREYESRMRRMTKKQMIEDETESKEFMANFKFPGEGEGSFPSKIFNPYS